MANEFRWNKSLTYQNGNLKYTFGPGTIQTPQATQGYQQQTVSATSVAADITFSNVTTKGQLIMWNLASTTTGGNVSWGPKTSTGGILKMGTLKAKETADMTMNTTTTLRIQRTAAGSTKVLFVLFEA